MLKIWGRTTSSNVQKVLWFCEEIRIPYERVDAGLSFGITRTPEYLAMNPTALIPTIEDEGFVLWESNAILRYLARKHQTLNWYPEDFRQRANVERWMDWASTALAAAITPVVWQWFRTAPDMRDSKLLLSSAEKATQCMRILEAHFAHEPWAAGDHISLADIPMAIQAYRWCVMPWQDMGYQPPDLPHVLAWQARLAGRDIYRKIVMTGIS